MKNEPQLNRRVYDALYSNDHTPELLISRIENCVLNAKTELAKRRLIRTTFAIGIITML